MSGKVFTPHAAALPSEPAVHLVRSPVQVVEVTSEGSVDAPAELPLYLAGAPGTVAVQLRSTVRRVAMGAGLARNEALVARVRGLPEVDQLVTSPAGGTFIVGGPAWLGLCAVGVPPEGQGMPLDWMLASLRPWIEAALAGHGVQCTMGRIEGAWCPGFSDISVGGRKLIGQGFRVTRDWVVMRGVMPVQPIDARDHAVLRACHALIGVEVRAEASTSLAECGGEPGLDVPAVIERWRAVSTSG